MDDEDEIDVLGEFNLDTLLTNNEEQISSYDGEHQLGLNCDSSWMLDSSQSSWYNSKSEPQPTLEEFSTVNSPESSDNNAWSDKEKYLLEKGLELFGRSYSRLAQYIGTKSSSQVKSYLVSHKPVGLGWSGKSSVSTSSAGFDGLDLSFSEIIHDMEIPASMEEVIAAVSTAQPTVVVPSSYRESSSPDNNVLTRKKCRRKKHSKSALKRNQVSSSHIFKAEDIKGVLTDNKEQDSIVLPTGEEVIRMRHGPSLSEDSEVDIDVSSEPDAKVSIDAEVTVENDDSRQHTTEELSDPKTESSEVVKEELFEFQEDEIIDFSDIKDELFLPHVEQEVSVFTESYIELETEISEVEKETQVFKGNLVTPSGKVMTVVVDDLPVSCKSNSRDVSLNNSIPLCITTNNSTLNAIHDLPPPTHEAEIQPHIVTREEQLLHPDLFEKNFLHGLNRYLKIRNHIIECWKNCKPTYLSNTSVHASPSYSKQEDIGLVDKIHAYLERKGYINFGCVDSVDVSVSDLHKSQYSNQPPLTPNVYDDYSDQVCSIVEVDSSVITDQGFVTEYTLPMAEYSVPVLELNNPRKGGRVRKKKTPFEDKTEKSIIPTPRIKKQGSKSKSTAKRPRKQQSLRPPPLWKPPKYMSNNKSSEGGYTMVHTVSGEVIVEHSQPRQPNKVHTRGIRPVRLIHCKNYATRKAPYKVELEVTVLLLVDIHSHLSPKCEVIGLLGGTYRVSDNILTITMAVPCRTVLSSNIHCDMCPVSQCESSEMITSRGLSVVGWYHSHPNFDPSPSDTDVDTQNTLQSWFNDSGQPFVGLIISPYFPSYDVSYYRCCQVESESKGPVPYQLEVKLINLFGSVICNSSSLKQPIESAFKTLQSYEPIRQLNVHKCLESAKHHLRKAVPKLEEERVSQTLREIRECIKDGFSSLVKRK